MARKTFDARKTHHFFLIIWSITVVLLSGKLSSAATELCSHDYEPPSYISLVSALGTTIVTASFTESSAPFEFHGEIGTVNPFSIRKLAI